MAEFKKQLVDADTLAQFAGLDIERIRQLQRAQVIKADNEASYKSGAGNRKMYDFLPSIQALLLYYRGKNISEMDYAKLKGQNLDNDLRALKLAEQQRQVVRVDDLLEVFNALITRMRVSLLGIGIAVSPNDKKLAVAIDKRIYRSLTELSTFNIDDFIKHGGASYIAQLEDEAGFNDDDDESPEK